MKKTEFSKLILIGVTIAVTVLTIFTLLIVWETKDSSPLSFLIPAWFTEFATATGYYFWKAKNENMIKIGGNKDADN